jgi:sugar-specific transcriptional regulator TrmB
VAVVKQIKQVTHTAVPGTAAKSILNGLRELGLSSYESQAYVALIRNPNISAPQLCNESGIPDSKIYFALEELQKKGLIVVSEGVPRHYVALRPKQALSKLKSLISVEYEAQLDKLNQLTIALEPLYARAERDDIELAYVVKGFENVLKKMKELVKDAKREVVVFIPNLSIYDQFEEQLRGLRRTGVKVRAAVPPAILKQMDRSAFSEIREMSPNCEDCWLVVVDGKTVISSSQWTTERCYAILTQDPTLVAMSREYYDSPRCCATP